MGSPCLAATSQVYASRPEKFSQECSSSCLVAKRAGDLLVEQNLPEAKPSHRKGFYDSGFTTRQETLRDQTGAQPEEFSNHRGDVLTSLAGANADVSEVDA